MLTIDYNSYRTTTPYGKRVRFLVLHYTALDFAASVKALTTGAASAHYLIPAPHDPSYKAAGFKGQRIFNLVAEEDRAWHAGVSGWARRDNLNDTSIGIEIVNQGYRDTPQGRVWYPFSEAQIQALIPLLKDIAKRHGITPDRIIGHSDIAPGRKVDPGPLFPWKRLADAGLVRRRRDEADRRRQYVELTAAGRAVIEEDREIRNAWLETAMAERLTDLERGVLLLAGPVLAKLADG